MTVIDNAVKQPALSEDSTAACEPAEIAVGVVRIGGPELPRTPFNLISAAVALIEEAADVIGIDHVDFNRIRAALGDNPKT